MEWCRNCSAGQKVHPGQHSVSSSIKPNACGKPEVNRLLLFVLSIWYSSLCPPHLAPSSQGQELLIRPSEFPPSFLFFKKYQLVLFAKAVANKIHKVFYVLCETVFVLSLVLIKFIDLARVPA